MSEGGSNPAFFLTSRKASWIASSQELLAMTLMELFENSTGCHHPGKRVIQ
jgi:hypothetical protein